MNVCCRARLLLLTVGGTLGSVPVLAGDWQQTISLPTTLEHDSNLSLSATNKQAVSRLIVLPAYNLVGTYEINEFTAGLGLRVERSSNQRASFNRNDPNLQFGWRHLTETGEFGLTAKYDEVSSRAAALEETGSVTIDSTRKTKSLGGLWRFAASELSALTFDAGYTRVSYDAGAQTGFNNLAAGIAWNYAWSERIEPFLRFSINRYDPEKSTATVTASDYSTVTGGVKIKTSERLEWTAQGGPSRISTLPGKTGWQGNLSMQYRGDRYDTSLNIGRSSAPSGDHGFVASDRAGGTFGYTVDERSGVGFSASWQGNKGNNPNTMQQLGGWASHVLSQFLHARLYYQHKMRHQNGQPDASGDVLGISLVYSPPVF